MNINAIRPTQSITKGIVDGRKIIRISFPEGNYTRADGEKLVKRQMDKYKNQNFAMMPSIKLSRGWRSVKQISSKDNDFRIDLYGEESDSFNKFVIYVWRQPEQRGGKDDHNDCLFWCIAKCIGTSEMKDSWNYPYKFKKRLNLERDDPVHVSNFPYIEENLKININCVGDYTYVSQSKYPKNVNIKLQNGHFSYVHDHKKDNLIHKIAKNSQKLVLFHEGDTCVNLYDGHIQTKISFDEFEILRKDYFGPYCYLYCKTLKTIVDEYKQIMSCSEQIHKASNGIIDYSKAGYSHKKMILKLLYNFTRSIQEPEDMTPLEEEYIRNCFTGGLIYSKKCDLDNAVCVDINSAYPSFLKSTSFGIPMKQGTFTKVDNFDKIIPYGIYRAKISRSEDENINKLFRFNKLDYYTHYDIYTAREMGLQIQLIDDDQANALLYDGKSRTMACSIFNGLIDLLYKLKQEKVTYSKPLLSTLWGALCEKDNIIEILKDTFEIPDGCKIIGGRPYGNTNMLEYVRIGGYFKHNYARFAPFLTSAVRRKVATVAFPIKENVYRIHTDSIVTDLSLDKLNIKTSNKLGEWKIENQGMCKIDGKNKPIFS
jgi:hypothetical protein